MNSFREADPNFTDSNKKRSQGGGATAMDEDLWDLADNGVWLVVFSPDDRYVLHTKWVFKTKRNADGENERFQGRIVSRGNEQLFGAD